MSINALTIRKLNLIDFSGARNRTLELSDGFNVIEGANESGKSTVAAFIKFIFYGFADKEERNIFTLLVSVSGIGPNTARMMLSALTTDEVRMALISGDVNKIKSVKGIGLKTAQRAIIELKDKVGKDGSGATLDLGAGFETNNHREEAFGALITLGFSKAAVEKVLNSILKKEPGCTSEEIIKKALKLL